MKANVWALVLAVGLGIGACGGLDGPATGEQPPLVLEADDVNTTEQGIIWAPIPGPWVDCEHMGRICKCKGDVIDCRNPRPKPKELQVVSAPIIGRR